jgi:selenocysteine lyase/cysteine desulfurase
MASAAAPAASADDPLGVRQDFPIVKNTNFLNAAYIAPVPRQVVAAGQEWWENKANHPMSVADLMATNNRAHEQFARLIGASVDEVGLLFSTAEGENVMASGLDLKPGDNVVIEELHYATEFVLYGTLAQTKGIELRIAKHRNGVVEAKDFEPLVDKRTRLISVALVSNQNGYKHNMRPIADLAHAHGALCYADAIQGLGMIPIDVKADGVDCLCSGSYKWLFAGFGVAPVYLRKEAWDKIKIDRYGEMNGRRGQDGKITLAEGGKAFNYSSRSFAEVHQLSAAMAYLEKIGIPCIAEYTIGLATRLHNGLVKQGYKMFTPPNNQSSIVTFYTTKPGAEYSAALKAANIEVTVRNGQIRVSPAMYNNASEIDRFLEVTKKLA